MATKGGGKMPDRKRFNGSSMRMVVLMVLIGSMVLVAGHAAAETVPPEEDASANTIAIETITVTAQKQEEDVQEVPIAITVFNEDSIEDKQIEGLTDLDDFVPNLIFNGGQSGRATPSMRGLTAPSFTFTTTTGLYVDGVPILNGVGYESDILDVERVEVLRGPQGTLYGKNTEAGAINIITKQPGNNFSAKVSARGGALLSKENGDGLSSRVSASLSGPIVTDKLYLGLAGLYYGKDGFMENSVTNETTNERKYWFGRGNLRWTPTEKLDISFIATIKEFDDGGPSTNNTDYGAASTGIPPQGYRKTTSNWEDGYNQSVVDSQALKAIYSIDDTLTLTSVTTRRVFHEDTAADWDFCSQTINHNIIDRKYKKVSQELRLDYAKGRLKWLVGAYYDKDDKGLGYTNISDYASYNITTDRSKKGNAHAFFTNLVYPVTQRLGVVAGLRWEHQESEFIDHLDGRNYEDYWETLSPKAGLEYRITPDIMTYGTVAKGHRSGGFNGDKAVTGTQYESYDTEELWSYEVGIKSALFNKRIILNAAAYYMDVNDMQVSEAVSILSTYVTNAAKATGKGVELEIMGRVTNGLTLSAGFGYSNIEFDEFADAKGDYSGNKNTNAPEYSFNLGAHYRHPTGFTARVDLIGYGEMYFDKNNNFSRDPYQIVNMKVGYETEHFDIYLYGKNVFDEDYSSYGTYSGYYTNYSDPGEVGLQLTYRF